MSSFCFVRILSSTFSLNKSILVTRCLILFQTDSFLFASIGRLECNPTARNIEVVPIPSIFEVRYAKRQGAMNKSQSSSLRVILASICFSIPLKHSIRPLA